MCNNRFHDQVFPTQVGVIPPKPSFDAIYLGVPHTGGGDPARFVSEFCEKLCSPHRWG